MTRLIEPVDLDTAEDLLKELLPVTGRLWEAFRAGGARPNWIFRGQRQATWALQASALRTEPPPFKDFPTVDPLLLADYVGTPAQKLEMYHVNTFIGLADDLGHHIPGVLSDN
ncbi:MAG TPA: hypothetical protein VF469_33035 [Kofleriaceae bacterium]